MSEPRWHQDPRQCSHENEHVCPTCDFDRYYAKTYPSCPWRIERLGYGGWYCLTTVTTRDRAEQELSWYRAHRYGPLRAHNRETGELIGGSDA